MLRTLPVVCALLALTPSALGAVRHVYAGQSIQAAIDLSADGDVVAVHAGTHVGGIDLSGKAIELIGLSGATATTLTAPAGGGSVIRCISGETQATRIRGFTVTGGTGDLFLNEIVGGGIIIAQASPAIESCRFYDNSADVGGGAYVFSGAPSFLDCDFDENHVGFGNGGAGISMESGNVRFVLCRFEGNVSVLHGGAVQAILSWPTFDNCVFAQNIAASGGAIRSSFSTVTLRNCTLVGNSADQGPAIRSSSSATTTLGNCIVWGHGGDPILDLAGGSTTATYSNIEVSFPGEGNISEDPRFEASGSVYRLMADSPCADRGDNRLLPSDVNADIEGEPRVVNDVVDIGAFEVQEQPCIGDATDDGDVGFNDMLLVLSSWGPCPGCVADLNGSGSVTMHDLLIVLSNWGPCD